MRKICMMIFLLVVVGCLVYGGKQEKIANQLSNEILQTGNAPQNVVSQTENQLSNTISKEETVLPVLQNSLEGKTIALIGDSLMEGYGNDFHGFDDYLAKSLPNTHFINHSKSGSTITDNSGTDNIIMLNQAKTLTGNPDIILLDGGANDIIGYSLGFLNRDLQKEIGKVDSNSNTISSGETVISDFEEVIVTLKNRFPNAKICYLQPFLLDEETISHLCHENSQRQEICTRRDAFYEELPKACEKWEVEFWEVSHHFSGTATTYRQDDWIHLKAEGYELLTPYLLQNLQGGTNEENYQPNSFNHYHPNDSYLPSRENVHHSEPHHNGGF